ncbi:MAG: signal peptide peptidase SppA [Deltaproteobacteria bacterium]|nr:signal peptide peptidase SppA [Deltaproteobacteria bacterium]
MEKTGEPGTADGSGSPEAPDTGPATETTDAPGPPDAPGAAGGPAWPGEPLGSPGRPGPEGPTEPAWPGEPLGSSPPAWPGEPLGSAAPETPRGPGNLQGSSPEGGEADPGAAPVADGAGAPPAGDGQGLCGEAGPAGDSPGLGVPGGRQTPGASGMPGGPCAPYGSEPPPPAPQEGPPFPERPERPDLAASASRPARPDSGAGQPQRPPDGYHRVPVPRKVPKAAPGERKRFFLGGFPLVILILGILSIGSCHYTVNDWASSVGKATDRSLTEPGIAILAIRGEIISTEWAVKAVKAFQADPNVKALLIRIDSPGGLVAPCQELSAALADFKKPKVASMGSVAASGGYYIAVAADSVYANPGTITGSIGVIMEAMEFSGAMEKIGVKSEVIKSGRYKDTGSPFRALRPDEREVLESMLMNVYEQFVADVMKGRSLMSEEAVRALADGRVYSGEEARLLGLVDEIGGYEAALADALRKAGLPADREPAVAYEDGQSSIIGQLFGSLDFLDPIRSAASPGLTMKFIYRPGL